MEESPSKRLKVSNHGIVVGGRISRQRHRNHVSARRTSDNDNNNVNNNAHIVTLPAGTLSCKATFELASACFFNILYMKQLIAYPTVQQLIVSLKMDESGGDAVSNSGVDVNALIYRRRRKSAQKSMVALLNSIDEFESLCHLQEIKTFGIFFGPSHSVPKALYTFDLPVASLKSSSAPNNAECKIETAVRALVRSLVIFWSGCGVVVNSHNSNIFIGAKLSALHTPGTSSSSSSSSSLNIPAGFIYKEQYDQLISRKKRVVRHNFQMQSKQTPRTEEQSTGSMSEQLRLQQQQQHSHESNDRGGDWVLLRKPFKVAKR